MTIQTDANDFDFRMIIIVVLSQQEWLGSLNNITRQFKENYFKIIKTRCQDTGSSAESERSGNITVTGLAFNRFFMAINTF